MVKKQSAAGMRLILAEWAGSTDEAVIMRQLGFAAAPKVASEKYTVRMAIEAFLAKRFRSQKTRQTYQQVLELLTDKYGDLPLGELGAPEIKAFLERPGISKPYRKPNTIIKERKTISALFEWAITNEHASKNPARQYKMLEVQAPDPVALTPPEQRTFLDLAKKSKRLGLRDYAMAMLFLYAGPRAMEVEGLRWSDVLLGEGLVCFHGKGEKDRKVPLLPTVAQALQDYREDLRKKGVPTAENGPVFLNSQGKRGGRGMTTDGIRHQFKNAFRSLGKPPGVSVHCLRHTFAVNLFWLGVEPVLIQRAMGHADFDTTALYLRLADAEMVREIRQRFQVLDPSTLNEAMTNEWKRGLMELSPMLRADREDA